MIAYSRVNNTFLYDRKPDSSSSLIIVSPDQELYLVYTAVVGRPLCSSGKYNGSGSNRGNGSGNRGNGGFWFFKPVFTPEHMMDRRI